MEKLQVKKKLDKVLDKKIASISPKTQKKVQFFDNKNPELRLLDIDENPNELDDAQ